MLDPDYDDTADLGSCCVCSTISGVRTILMLDALSPIPGRGWGCFVCDLPRNGAVAVLCDACTDQWQASTEALPRLRFACRGYPASDGRAPIGAITGTFHHDPRKHHEAD